MQLLGLLQKIKVFWGYRDIFSGVDFKNCFAPNANLLHPMPNFYTIKKLLPH